MTIQNQQTQPEQVQTQAQAPAPTTPPVQEAKSPQESEELKALKAKLDAFEKREAEAEKAKLSESERVKAEKVELNRERFQLALEKAGLSSDEAALFDHAPETTEKRKEMVAKITKVWQARKAKEQAAAPNLGAPIDPATPPKPDSKLTEQKTADRWKQIGNNLRKPSGAK